MKIVKNLVISLLFLVMCSLGIDVVGQQTQEPSLFNPNERPSRPVHALPSQAVIPPTQHEYITIGNTDRFHRPNRPERVSSRTNLLPFQNLPKSLNLQVRGLVMMRDNATNQALTSNAASETVLSTRDADMDTSGGVEISLGKTLEDKTQRIEMVYWGLFTRGDNAVANDAGSELNSLLNISGLSYNGFGNPLSAVFNNSATQSLTRTFEYHNVEWNFTSDMYNKDRTQSVRLLAGFRYFKADDRFNLNIDDVAYSVSDDNHLFGAQVGALWTKQKGRKMTYHIGVKTGVFFNAIDHRTKILGAAGHAFVEDPAIMNWRDDFNEYSKKTDMSFLGQLELGFDYLLTPSCQLTAGYRVMGVTGMAFATDQIPASFAEAALGQPVTSDGSLIMHGAYIGIDWNF